MSRSWARASTWPLLSGSRHGAPPIGLTLPAAVVGIVLALPVIYLLLRALNAGPELLDFLFSIRILAIFLRSLALTMAVTALAVLIGVPLAWLTTRTDIPFRRFWLIAATLPLVIPTYVSGLAFITAFGPKGLVQGLLAPLGVERLPDFYGFPGALLVLTLHTYPYVMLTVRVALQRLDPSMEEAARNLGRSKRETFWQVLLPQLRPGIMSGALLAALYSLGDFGAVSLMNYEAFTWAIYVQYQSAFDRSLAAGLSLVLVAVTAFVLLGEAMTRRNVQYYRSDPGTSRERKVDRLGPWKAPSLIFSSVLLLIALVLPLGVLITWAARGIAAGQSLNLFMNAAFTSVSIAAMAAVCTVLAALPIAILAVRYPGPLTRLLESATYIGFALPRIALALGLVFFGANYMQPLYQTLFLLLLAYAILFLPTALGGIGTSLRQVTPHLEEAARSLGMPPWLVFFKVTLPIVLPGVIAGAALVFLLTMEELPATLLLRPPGVETLATSIWSAASEALFAQAAVPSLFLVVASSVSVALLFRQEGR